MPEQQSTECKRKQEDRRNCSYLQSKGKASFAPLSQVSVKSFGHFIHMNVHVTIKKKFQLI